MDDEVLYEVRDHVAYVTINRPERRNALNLSATRDMIRRFIIVQRAEFEYAIDPLEPNRVAFEGVNGIASPWVPVLDRFTTVTGDAPVMPGISLVHLPGHTPGSEGVLVDTGSRRYLVAGDCVDQHDNLTGDEKLRHIPSGSFTKLHDYMDSFGKIEQLACEVIPRHDFAVLKEGTFGE